MRETHTYLHKRRDLELRQFLQSIKLSSKVEHLVFIDILPQYMTAQTALRSQLTELNSRLKLKIVGELSKWLIHL
jgi:hypothetical protein